MPNIELYEHIFSKGFAAGANPDKRRRPYRIFREHWLEGLAAGRRAVELARADYRARLRAGVRL